MKYFILIFGTIIIVSKTLHAQPDYEEMAKRVIVVVLLMTPEAIHVNSFMYEPILDMSDHHLKKLFEITEQLNA